MYELYIKCLDGVWRLADLGEDNPAMNYQANDIAELKNRQSDYSQALKLPISQNNAKIFNFSNESDVVTSFPYQLHNCRLFCNDCTLAGKGSFLILDRVTQYFECQILSGNADFFELLKNSKVEELNLGSVILKEEPDILSTDVYSYAKASFVANRENNTDDQGNVFTFPFVKLKYIIEQLVSQNGYTLTHNLQGRWEKKALSICSLKSSEGSFDHLEASAKGQYSSFNRKVMFDIVKDGEGSMVIENYQEYIRYTTLENGTIDVRYTMDSDHLGSFRINIQNKTRGITIADRFITDIETIYTVDVNKGDIIEVSATRAVGQNLFTLEVFFQNIQYSTVPNKGKLFFAPNIGFKYQLDLFKAFAQVFGLTILIDNATKTVYAYTMDILYENKQKTIDWSSKLHEGIKRGLEFTIKNYAQQNNINFETDNENQIIDVGSFVVDNLTLEKSKDLFSIAFEAGKDISFLENGEAFIVAYIPLIELKDDSNNIKVGSFKERKPHIVELNNVNETIVANHVKAQFFIDTFYNKLTNNMLHNAKQLEEEFYLTDQDIEEFNQFTPVYLHKYGAFYYVNKIKNYISGYLTTCELIRL